MRKILMIFCSGLFTAYAQTEVKPQAIITSGKSFQKPNSGVSFTIGEIVVKTMKSNDASLSNGVIASAVPFVVTKTTSNTKDIRFQLFPNPATQMATFQMVKEKDIPLVLIVSNLQGQQVMEQNLPHSFTEYSFPVQTWSKGLYLLNVYDQNGANLGSIKFQKL